MKKILILCIAALLGVHAYADEKTSAVAGQSGLDRGSANVAQVSAADLQQLKHRLQTLQSELTAGEKTLRDLEQQEAQVRQTMARIREAIRVIQEELAKAGV
jgi:septal ring factor EnvC (AmiA/AmiB activator)